MTEVAMLATGYVLGGFTTAWVLALVTVARRGGAK